VKLVPSSWGATLPLLRDITTLSAHLRTTENDRVRELARAGLSTIIATPGGNGSDIEPVSLEAWSFLASQTVRQIRGELGEKECYTPPLPSVTALEAMDCDLKDEDLIRQHLDRAPSAGRIDLGEWLTI
jgi:hypothetical protein